MESVAIGSQMRANLLSLQRTNSLMDKTQFNLSTGRKVNSALDGAQAFFAAQSLTNRASDLNRLLDSMGQSIQTIKAADKGISALTDLISQAEAIATQAEEELGTTSSNVVIAGDKDLSEVTDLTSLNGITANDDFQIQIGATNSGDINIDAGDTIADLVNDINGSAVGSLVTASVNSAGQLELTATNDGDFVRILDAGTAAVGAAGLQSLGLGEFIASENDGGATTRTAGTVVAGNTLTSTATATKASDTLAASGFITPGANSADIALVVDGLTSATLNVDTNTTVQEFIDHVNNDPTIGSKLTASFDEATGAIELTGAAGVSTIEFEATAVGGAVTTSFGFAGGGTDFAMTTAGHSASEFITLTGGSSNISQLETDYNEVRSQIDALVVDANYRGVNLLKGDNMTTTFNEDGSSSLVTSGQDFTAAGLGLAAGNFTNIGGATSAVDEAKSALNSVRDFGSSISNQLTMIQTREVFTQDTIQVLEEGSDKLTLADSNEEGAKMLALQTRLQLGVTSMSLAAQSQQSVLSMF